MAVLRPISYPLPFGQHAHLSMQRFTICKRLSGGAVGPENGASKRLRVIGNA